MIEYFSKEKELKFTTKDVPQLSGAIAETVILESYNDNYEYYLELLCPQNKRFISSQIKFEASEGKILLPNQILANTGKIYIQLVIRNVEGIVIEKSILTKQPIYNVTKSVNAIVSLEDEQIDDCFSELINITNKSNTSINNTITKVNEMQSRYDDNIVVQNEKNQNFTNKLSVLEEKMESIDSTITINRDCNLLFFGNSREIKIENFDSYDLFLIVICFGQEQNTIIYDPYRTYEKGLSILGMSISTDNINGAVVSIENNTFKLIKSGYYQNNVWNEASWYCIGSIYGIKTNRGIK